MPDLLAHLREAVGGAHVLTSPDDVAAYAIDWTGTHRGTPLAVVRPGSTAEVSAVVRACHDAGVAVVPQGGNTGLVAGGVPDSSGSQVVLSLQLPFAVIPLVLFTARRRIMGNLVAPRWLTVATGIIAAIIVALNVKLLFDTFIAGS